MFKMFGKSILCQPFYQKYKQVVWQHLTLLSKTNNRYFIPDEYIKSKLKTNSSATTKSNYLHFFCLFVFAIWIPHILYFCIEIWTSGQSFWILKFPHHGINKLNMVSCVPTCALKFSKLCAQFYKLILLKLHQSSEI